MWQCNCGCSSGSWFAPPCPPAPCPPPGINGPINGVVSGVPAQAGQVGEFIQRSINGSVTVANGSATTSTVLPLTLGPGDWDVEAVLTTSLLFSGASFQLNPSVPGMSSTMYSSIKLPGAVAQLTTASLPSGRNQLITAQLTSPLQYDVIHTNNTGSPVTASFTLTVTARRMR